MSICGLIMVCGAESCFADYILYPRPSDAAIVISEAFCATVVIEFVIIYWMLRRPSKARGRLFLLVLGVNLISYPLAQVAFVSLPPSLSLLGQSPEPHLVIFKMLGIELFVVVLEYWLLKQIFKDMYRVGALSKTVSGRKTLATAIVANLATFLLGIVGWIASALFIDSSFR